jgi:predicted nucleotidyltransferase
MRIGIFGSVARGKQKEDSDVDVFFESETISLFKMGGLLNALEVLERIEETEPLFFEIFLWIRGVSSYRKP